MECDVVTQRTHPRLALADTLQHQPEGRADHQREQYGAGDEHAQRQVVVLPVQRREIGPSHAADAVFGARHARPAICQAPHQHALGHGDHHEKNPGGAHGE